MSVVAVMITHIRGHITSFPTTHEPPIRASYCFKVLAARCSWVFGFSEHSCSAVFRNRVCSRAWAVSFGIILAS